METEQRPRSEDDTLQRRTILQRSTPRQRLRLALLRALGLPLRLISPMQSSPPPSDASILLIRPDHLGDLLFLTPALRYLREGFPDAHITLMVGPWGQEMAEENEYVDDVITCSFPGFERQAEGSLLAPYRMALREARKVRRKGFDLVLVMRFDHWWGAVVAAAAGIPRRIGYATSEVEPILTQALPHVAGLHEVQQNLNLVSSLAFSAADPGAQGGDPGAFPLAWREEIADAEWASRWLLLQGAVAERPLVAIHAGSGAAVKLWTTDKWAAVADALSERRDAQILLTGSAGELDRVWAIAARMRTDPLIAAGETTLGQLAALYAQCRLVMGPDCGPLHLAVAVDTPTVHLYGPVDARTFGPWGDSFWHRVVIGNWPCVPCNRIDYAEAELPAHLCVRDIGVDQVLAQAEPLLAGAR